MLMKKIICILLATVLILGTSITSWATDVSNNEQNVAQENTQESENKINLTTEEINELNGQKDELDDKLEEANNRLEYVQGEMSSTLLEIQKLSDKITQYESENEQLEERLSTLNTSIKETNELLNTVTTEYTEKNELLKQRLAIIYEKGEITLLDLLMSSASLSEFLSRYYAIKELAEYDNQLIDEVEKQKDTIELSKQKLETETSEAKTLKAKAEQNEIVMKNTRTLYKGYEKKLSDEERELNNKINEYKVEYARIQAKLQGVSTDIGDFQIQYTGGKMLWPVAISGTVITSYYGTRVYPIQGTNVVTDFHLGLDIAAPAGSPVVAALDGVVTYAGWLGTYGNCVMIYHGDGITTVYGHSQRVLTQRGKEVKQGELIMEVGSTGNSTGPHCHFEVRINGQTTDPLQFVNKP